MRKLKGTGNQDSFLAIVFQIRSPCSAPELNDSIQVNPRSLVHRKAEREDRLQMVCRPPFIYIMIHTYSYMYLSLYIYIVLYV